MNLFWEARFAASAIGTSGAVSKVKAGHVTDFHTSESIDSVSLSSCPDRWGVTGFGVYGSGR